MGFISFCFSAAVHRIVALWRTTNKEGLQLNRHILLFGAFMSLICGTADQATARGVRIPIVWGHGEELTELGELPQDVAQDIAEELGTPVTVAFLHNRVHVFWLDLWTWNGRHVLHSGDKYWEPDSTTWQQMIGEDPSAKYGTPFFYRIPSLPGLLVIAVIGYAVRRRFFKTEQEKLEAIFNDERYQRSLRTLFGTGDHEQPAKVITSLDEDRFLRAKNELIGDGVDAHSAEANLRKIAVPILAQVNAQVDAAFAQASQFEQQGKWDESAEIYSHLISTLPCNDERLTHARDCLASINDQRAANATEQLSQTEPPGVSGLDA